MFCICPIKLANRILQPIANTPSHLFTFFRFFLIFYLRLVRKYIFKSIQYFTSCSKKMLFRKSSSHSNEFQKFSSPKIVAALYWFSNLAPMAYCHLSCNLTLCWKFLHTWMHKSSEKLMIIHYISRINIDKRSLVGFCWNKAMWT